MTTGQSATFTVVGAGSGPLAYQWRHFGFPIGGATTDTLVLPAPMRSDAGFYDVLVTDSSGTTIANAARLSVKPRVFPTDLISDGEHDLQLESTLYPPITALLPMPDGGYFAAGSLASVDNERRTLVMRVNADGTLNQEFAPSILGEAVSTLAIDADGKIVIGGTFQAVGAFHRLNLARLNADGSLDSSFAPDFKDLSQVVKVVVQPDRRIVMAGRGFLPSVRRLNPDGTSDPTWNCQWGGVAEDIVLQADGRIIIAGMSNDSTRPFALVRLNTDGSLDSTFSAGSIDSEVRAVTLDASGRILVGGIFATIGGAPAAGIARLLPSGALDPSFSASTLDQNSVGPVDAIDVQEDGKILLGGGFDMLDGVPRRCLGRVNADGTLDNFLASATPTQVNAVAELRDGSVVAAASEFSSDSSVQAGLARFFSSGSLDPHLDFSLRSMGVPNAVAALPDGQFLVTGNFDFARNIPSHGLLRLNADGAIDAAFSARTTTLRELGAMTAAVALPDGRVVIGGNFPEFEGQPRPNIVMLAANGYVDLTFAPSPSAVSTATSLALTPDGRIVMAGVDHEAGNGGDHGAIAMYRLDGSADPTFATGPKFDAQVSSIAVQSDGRIFAGGWFGKYDGQAVHSLVRINRDGSLDGTFQPQLPSGGPVQIVALAPLGKVIAVVGYIYGTTIIRLNADGSADPTFTASSPGGISALLVQEDGKIIIRSITPMAGANGSFVARLNLDGSFDPTFRASGIYDSNSFYSDATLLMRDDGQLIVCDPGVSAGHVLLTRASSPPVIMTAPQPLTVAPLSDAVLAVVAQSDLPLGYQWNVAGHAIAGATNSMYTIHTFGPTQVGAYSVTVTNDFGSVTSDSVAVAPPIYDAGRLTNLSVRTNVGSGDSTLIVGIVLGGAGTSGNAPLLFRGVGPSLSPFGVSGALADPVLQLYDAAGVEVAENDDWTGGFDFSSVGAFPFSGSNPKDAAVYLPQATTGPLTMHVLAKSGAIGVSLAEVYDALLPQSVTAFTPRLINGSARAPVATGDGVLILGFTIGGRTSVPVLVRAAGPAIAVAPFNVAGTLSDPMLQIYDASGAIVATNNDWGEQGAADQLKATFAAVGAFPFATGSADAALSVTLMPGSYTAVVRDAKGGTGIALVEIYEQK